MIMSDSFAKKALRPLLEAHNDILNFSLEIKSKANCKKRGTRPSCRQSITPVDLFNFLEPIPLLFGDIRPGAGVASLGRQNSIYSNYDYSLTLGQGYCTPVWFPMLLVDMYSFSTLGFEDCKNLGEAVMDNIGAVRGAMTASLQPPTEYVALEDVIGGYDETRGAWLR